MKFSDSISLQGLPVRRPPPLNRFFSSTPVSIIIYCFIVSAILYSSFTGAQSMGYNWQWYQIPKYIYTYTEDGFQFGELMLGLWKTITLSFTAFILAMVIGLLVALLRLSGLLIGTKVAICFLEFVRNVPLLVLVYLFYYVLGPVFKYDRYTASILCLAVYHSALISEILRAGINAVAQGQWEAAKTTSSIAVERLPESASGLINLICADFYLGNIDDALWNLEEFIIINPDFDLSRATLNENKLWRKLTIECFQKLENSLNN